MDCLRPLEPARFDLFVGAEEALVVRVVPLAALHRVHCNGRNWDR